MSTTYSFMYLIHPRPIYRIQADEKGKKVAMVALYPKLELAEDETLYSEIIFVIDRYYYHPLT